MSTLSTTYTVSTLSTVPAPLQAALHVALQKYEGARCLEDLADAVDDLADCIENFIDVFDKDYLDGFREMAFDVVTRTDSDPLFMDFITNPQANDCARQQVKRACERLLGKTGVLYYN